MNKHVNILVYHGKHGDLFWLVDTPERFAKAKQALFNMLDEFGCYGNGEPYTCPYVERARQGDPKAVTFILTNRQDREYESWSVVSAEVPE